MMCDGLSVRIRPCLTCERSEKHRLGRVVPQAISTKHEQSVLIAGDLHDSRVRRVVGVAVQRAEAEGDNVRILRLCRFLSVISPRAIRSLT